MIHKKTGEAMSEIRDSILKKGTCLTNVYIYNFFKIIGSQFSLFFLLQYEIFL